MSTGRFPSSGEGVCIQGVLDADPPVGRLPPPPIGSTPIGC